MIQNRIGEYKPNILGIGEASLRQKLKRTQVQINYYQLITTNTIENPMITNGRIIIYVKSNMEYMRRKDLENLWNSLIWLEVKFKVGEK